MPAAHAFRPVRFARLARALRRAALGTALLAAIGSMPSFGPSPAHAALFDDDEARRAILDLRGRMAEQQRQIDAISHKLDDLASRTEPAARSQLDTQNQLESMRQEIARLRGQIEVQANELANSQRRERDLFTDLDTRLKKFEPTPVQLDGKTVSVDPDERKSYEAALAQFRAGDFRAAQSSFQQFIQQSPDSAYVPNAMFWLGSAQFAQKDYKSAISTHQSLLNKFPDNARAPDAMLNLAYAQIESGDRAKARKTLETVTTRYPDSPASQAAKERLASLK
ncbi:MAG: tol-pal system protein YbgF [Burkholderiaceae bacterium]